MRWLDEGLDEVRSLMYHLREHGCEMLLLGQIYRPAVIACRSSASFDRLRNFVRPSILQPQQEMACLLNNNRRFG
jgi:lipoate synthase